MPTSARPDGHGRGVFEQRPRRDDGDEPGSLDRRSRAGQISASNALVVTISPPLRNIAYWKATHMMAKGSHDAFTLDSGSKQPTLGLLDNTIRSVRLLSRRLVRHRVDSAGEEH